MDPPADDGRLHRLVVEWYAAHARDLPWRDPGATPWQVLVSEVMLQQTPVARVLPVYREWVARWPAAADLAAGSAGDAVRAWGRLGYPRRALRLHACAVAITAEHAGVVPRDLTVLRTLPGVGEYTAAAVASFAFHERHAVLDTNIRRVLARVVSGEEHPPLSLTVAERALAARLLPAHPQEAARWSVGVMELGALVCAASSPWCDACPVAEDCRWRQAGYPAYAGPVRRGQSYAGTDRQCRGRLLAVLRDAPEPIRRPALDAAWPEPVQRERALDGLVADGLVEPLEDGRFALPL